MQVGDRRVVPFLKGLSGSGRGGARGLAGFALGRLGDPTAVDALDRLSRSGQPTERMMAYLALGRLGGRGPTERLDRRLRERKLPAREHEAVIVALGLTGSGDVAPRLRRILETSGKDGLRRAAAVAAGYLDANVAWPLLRPRVSGGSENDKRVRVIALKGCARMSPSADRFAALLKLRPDTISDAHEEAAWVLALAAAGGERELMILAKSALSSPREEVREALAAATVVVGGNRASALASVLLGDPKDRVTRAALLAVVIHSRTNNTLPPLVAFAKHTDEQVRRTALCGDVYLRGAVARRALQGCLTPQYKDDVRDLAKQLLVELGDDESAARMLCRARLQRLLDENGLAPSWNLNAAATALVYEILDLEDATDRRGSGQPPGARPSGRPAPPAIGPSPQEEDLRRHLDRYPYIDLRHRIEVPSIE